MSLLPSRVRLFLAVALTLTPLAAHAQLLEQKLTAPNPSNEDKFGEAVSVFSDVAIVGVPGEDLSRGSAYVYRRVDGVWVEEQKLMEPVTFFCCNLFGHSVSISGDVIVVGVPKDNDNGTPSGAAYVFRYDGDSWVEEQKFTAADGSSGDWYGSSVSVSGDVAVVGVLGDDEQRGSAYVFRRIGGAWVEEQKLTASDGSAAHRLGTSISISGDVALVGAPHENSAGPSRGAAYVFRWVGGAWVEEQKLTASDASNYDEFGHAVSVSGDVALVGAYEDDNNSPDSGAAYVFRRVGGVWVEEQKLTASDGSGLDNFGSSVSVSGDIAAVGAMNDDDNGRDSGSAYVFRRVGGAWIEDRKLTAHDGTKRDRFGNAISVSGSVVFVGASNDKDNGFWSGSAYAFALDGPDCAQSLTATLDDATPAPGQDVTFAVTVSNASASPAPLDLWLTATGTAAAHLRLGAGVVPGGATVSRDVRLRLYDGTPPGTYDLTLAIGAYGASVCDAVGFSMTVDTAPREVTAAAEGALLEVVRGFDIEGSSPAAATEAAPTALRLHAPSPNPSAGRTMLRYALPEAAAIRLAVYDVLGREVAVLVDGGRAAGAHEAAFDATGLPSGTYLVRLGTGERILTRRVTVAR